jgi:periplasmic protein TonB
MSVGIDMLESRRVFIARWLGAAILIVAAHIGCTALAVMRWHEHEVADAAGGAMLVDMVPVPPVPVDSPDVAHGPNVEEAMLAPLPTLESKDVPIAEEQPKLEPAPLAPEPEVALPIETPPEPDKPKQEDVKEAAKEKVETQESAAPLTMAPPKVEPTEEPARVAPAAGQSSERVKRLEASWQKALVSHLNRFKRYPGAARARGSQGSVLVEFTIDRSGNVVASRVLRHSGSSFLDEEAISVLQRASPLPSPPAEITGELFPLTLPIQFRIK